MQDTRTSIPFHGRSGMDLASSLLEGFLQYAGVTGSTLDGVHTIEPVVGAAGSLEEMIDALVRDIMATCNDQGALPIGGEIAHAVAGSGEFRAWGHLYFSPGVRDPQFSLQSGGVAMADDHGTHNGTFWVDVTGAPRQ